jgi:hypothetical protein
VSAICASPADSGIGVVDTVPLDKVRALQHTLYRTAKADPGRRFHALWGLRASARPLASGHARQGDHRLRTAVAGRRSPGVPQFFYF